MSSPRKVSDSTVRRLSTYLRILEGLAAKKAAETVSSSQLAEIGQLTPAQVRKDLSLFGSFGVRGRGYDIDELHAAIRGILGLDQDWPTIVIGAGRLGSALTSYPNFRRHGFRIVALFDVDPRLVGRSLGGAEVRSMTEVADWIREHEVRLAIVTTPAEAAQSAADEIVAAGIGGILNFTPTTLDVPEPVVVRNVNLTIELEGLCFAVQETAAGASSPEKRGSH